MFNPEMTRRDFLKAMGVIAGTAATTTRSSLAPEPAFAASPKKTETPNQPEQIIIGKEFSIAVAPPDCSIPAAASKGEDESYVAYQVDVLKKIPQGGYQIHPAVRAATVAEQKVSGNIDNIGEELEHPVVVPNPLAGGYIIVSGKTTKGIQINNTNTSQETELSREGWYPTAAAAGSKVFVGWQELSRSGGLEVTGRFLHPSFLNTTAEDQTAIEDQSPLKLGFITSELLKALGVMHDVPSLEGNADLQELKEKGQLMRVVPWGNAFLALYLTTKLDENGTHRIGLGLTFFNKAGPTKKDFLSLPGIPRGFDAVRGTNGRGIITFSAQTREKNRLYGVPVFLDGNMGESQVLQMEGDDNQLNYTHPRVVAGKENDRYWITYTAADPNNSLPGERLPLQSIHFAGLEVNPEVNWEVTVAQDKKVSPDFDPSRPSSYFAPQITTIANTSVYDFLVSYVARESQDDGTKQQSIKGVLVSHAG